jgi:hypothetical protein
MTGAARLRIAGTSVRGKIGPWQTASAVCHDRNVCSLLAGNADFAFFKAQSSLGLSWNA